MREIDRWVRFDVQDEGAGLNTVEVMPKDAPRVDSDNIIYYRF